MDMTPSDIEAYHMAHALFLAIPLVLMGAGLAVFLALRERRRRIARRELLLKQPHLAEDPFKKHSMFGDS